MSNFRKYAWFHLAVCAATVLAVVTLLSVTGNGPAAMAGFATLALLGLGEMYFRSGRRRPCEDERDQENERKAVSMAYLVFWLCFVAWGTVLSMRFSSAGQVPLHFVTPAVFTAWWLVTAVRATTALVLDGRQG